MQSARRADSGQVTGRGAKASRPTPLTIVSGAVAGDDLASVASATSEALGRAVAIAIPSLGEPVSWPPGALSAAELEAVLDHAAQLIHGSIGDAPGVIADAVLVRIGDQVLGVVAAGRRAPGAETAEAGAIAPEADALAWLEAGAAAAAVAALMRETRDKGAEHARSALLTSLLKRPPIDLPGVLGQARRLGIELSAGAIAVFAKSGAESNSGLPVASDTGAFASTSGALMTELDDGRVFGLAALSPTTRSVPDALVAELEASGYQVVLSAPRHEPAALHEALREAELLLELTAGAGVAVGGLEETYRLLIGVLLRNRDELQQLRAGTISPLSAYDAEHDTELLATLQAFLDHHGSTSETADAMGLHRHTVGYRLSRAHEVSGLSPQESDGRERLSLGLKAQQILEADERLRGHTPSL